MSGEQPPPSAPPGSNEQWPSYTPDPGPPSPEVRETLPPTHVPYGTPTPHDGSLATAMSKARPRGLTRVLIALVPLVVIGAVGLFAFSSFSDDFSEITDTFSDGIGDLGTPSTNVHSVDGFGELLDAIANRTGRTEAFDVTLYPDYAYLEVPEDATSKRSRRLYWNGALEDRDQLGTATQERFDLADVDASLLLRLLRRVSTLVEDPTSNYVLIRGASVFDDQPTISAYATNEYSEGAYIETDLTGKVIRTVSWPTP